jgi:hypothetical protein
LRPSYKRPYRRAAITAKAWNLSESAMKALSYPTAMADDISENGFGKTEGVPTTFVVDSGGVVRDKFIDVYDKLLKDVVIPLLTD